VLAVCTLTPAVSLAAPKSGEAARSSSPSGGALLTATPVAPAASAFVNFAELARLEALGLAPRLPVRPLIREDFENEMDQEPGADVLGPVLPEALFATPPFVPFVASPSPTSSFMGLDDIPMADSSYIVIPPDVGGAVGLSKVMSGYNNNYRIFNKSNGSVVSTVGTATFWAPVVPAASRLTLTDPRTVYDPINNRWIVCMISDIGTSSSSIEIGVSQTSDPNGGWYLFRTVVFESASIQSADFPILGFNKNWVTVTVNMYTSAGAFTRGKVLMLYYPNLRAGTFTGFAVTRAAGTGFCASPCVTYSATSETLYVPTHLSSGAATYQLDRITGSGPAAPTYVVGSSLTRTGGAWVQPSGNQLPQSAPNSGTSACGATPCPMESQDAQIRSAPVYRGGFIYYTQSVGLPAGAMTHTAAQWTKLNTPGGTVADGGRIDDATATSTNGGKWYSHPHVAVNANHDFMVGYTQFSSAQHPAAGYSVHLAGDAAGSIRDAAIYHAGEDYYHKTFSTATGRNRWGDFSSAQVDPSDDMTLWTVQEYGKTRTGTDDGNTGSNSSRWSTWWVSLAPPTVTIDAGPSLNEGNGGTTAFNFTARLSYAYGLPVTVNYQTSNGTATVADNDYQAATSSIIIPAGSTTGTITVNGVGDTRCEPNETFSVTLTSTVASGNTNTIPIGAPSVSTATIVNDDVSQTITATAGAGGTISPSGAVVVACADSQAFLIAPSDKCHAIADVKVDGVSVGAVASYTFLNVQAPHTIAATFAPLGSNTITASAGPGGTISPDSSVVVACGDSVTYSIAPSDKCHAILDVKVDGVSVGAVSAYTFTDVQANHTIDATFATLGPFKIAATAGPGGSISPDSSVIVPCGGNQAYSIAPSDSCHVILDLKVDGVSVGADSAYTFTDVQANHTIEASFSAVVLVLSETHVNASCFDSSNGSIDLSVAGGDAPYTYAWSNGPTTEDVSGLAPGLYTVLVIGASGCTASLGVLIGAPQYSIAASSGANGSIAPSGGVPVDCGSDTTFDITPDAGYLVDSLTVDGAPVTPAPSYTFTHVSANHTIHVTFKLEVTAVDVMPVDFALGRVSPNPATGMMWLRFAVPQESAVRVSVVDLQGRDVAELTRGTYPAGWHEVRWNGRTERGPAPAGMYFVRFQAEGRNLFRRLVLTR